MLQVCYLAFQMISSCSLAYKDSINNRYWTLICLSRMFVARPPYPCNHKLDFNWCFMVVHKKVGHTSSCEIFDWSDCWHGYSSGDCPNPWMLFPLSTTFPRFHGHICHCCRYPWGYQPFYHMFLYH